MNPRNGQVLYVSLMLIAAVLVAVSAVLLLWHSDVSSHDRHIANLCTIGAGLCVVATGFLKMRLNRQKSKGSDG